MSKFLGRVEQITERVFDLMQELPPSAKLFRGLLNVIHNDLTVALMDDDQTSFERDPARSYLSYIEVEEPHANTD